MVCPERYLVARGYKKVQQDEHQRQYPEHIPRLRKIVILHHRAYCVGGRKERIARLVQLGSLVEAMCSTDVMDNYTSREDLKTTVTKALEHNVRTSDGMNWNLHDLVYEALSEEWGRRDGEISDLWADDGPSGYQPPSYEPVNPERRTPQTPSDGLI